MKTIFYLAILYFSALSCSKSEGDNSTKPSVVGKWKQIELYNSDGGSSPSWHTITNGYTIELLSNGTFNSTKHSECTTGSYTISSTNEISMTYNCSGFTNNFIEKIETITNTQLILKPIYINCDEGCSVKFAKLN
ncbi:hypothetical protein [Flavobacterium nackdongense]|uniref:Lipocalin-like domain-containing protein n=1 Tax=Flavobacterium nackdongense TaxID=2547394 RepID=A0A4P6YGX1_9FLAO|nr:hypothetical protein [Flavobacterium nackdongense]QBN20184.1 hypothetical protein E1750_15740 [Flavobacterium nackdongense]